MDGWEVLIVIGTVVFAFLVWMILTIVGVWAERRVAAIMQTRVGPNRAGPMGILQTIADGLKLVVKESVLPRQADRLVYEMAPLLGAIPAFLAFAIIPFGPGFTINGYQVNMQVANLNVGVLWFLAMSAVGVYAAMLAGWSSGSKYPLLGGVRASAQVISYEAAMGLSIIPVVLFAGSVNTLQIVEAQSTYRWFFLPLFIPFIFFMISGIAETNRPPFDLVEAESELVGGFHTEYSGARFMLFYLAEYINTITICALTVTLFLGGFNGPVPFGPAALWGFIWFLLKTIALVFVFFWIRVTLPRLRYDQLMQFGWKMIIPANLVYLMLVAVYVAFAARGDLPQYWSGG